MYPSSARTFRRSSFRRAAGRSTRSCPERIALRSRFKRSLIGSLTFIVSLPGSLHDARDVARGRVLAKTDSAEAEAAEHAARPPANAAAAHGPCHELRLLGRFDSHRSSRHRFLYLLKGMPSSRRSARARSSRPAVVTIVTFSPLDLSVLE